MPLNHLASDLQQLYRIEPMPPVMECLISAGHYARYCRRQPAADPTSREAIVVEQHPTHIDVGLYIAPAIMEHITRDPPWQHLHGGNIDDSCVAIEGISHLVCLWWKVHRELPCSLLELELQAEIDKYLLCSQWLREQGHAHRGLMGRLFHHYYLTGGMTAVAAQRYRRASRLAWHFCRRGDGHLATLVARARDFYRLTHWQKLRVLPIEPHRRLR